MEKAGTHLIFIIVMATGLVLSSSCNILNKNEEPDLVLGFGEFKIGDPIENFAFCLNDGFTQDESYFRCNLEYPETARFDKNLFSLEMKFDKTDGLQYVAATYLYDRELKEIFYDAFPGLENKSQFSSKYYDLLLFNFIESSSDSIPKEYLSTEGEKRNFQVKTVRTSIIELRVDDFNLWKTEKAKLTEEEVLRLEAKQLYRFSENIGKLKRESINIQVLEEPNLFESIFKVNMRSKPYMHSEINYQLSKGDIVKPTGITSNSKDKIILNGERLDGIWMQVEFDGLKGWVHSGALSEINENTNDDFRIIPGALFGKISFEASISDIRKIMKERDIIIKDDRYSDPPTVLFPGTGNELAIHWKSERMNEINYIWYSDKSSQWNMSSGLKIGDPLEKIRRINGKEFTILGPWSHERTRSGDWNNGKLNKNVRFFFDSKFRDRSGDYDFLEDRKYTSNDEEIIKSQLVVDGIMIFSR